MLKGVEHQAAILVKKRALELGFSQAGITNLQDNSHGEHLVSWISLGMSASMTYMVRQLSRRLEPSKISPGSSRAIVVTRGYFSPDPPERRGYGLVAKYARGPDYHDSLAGPMKELVQAVIEIGGSKTITKAYVDAGPVPERELAWRAGIGWIGKNSMLIDPSYGSFFFIGCVLTDLELEVDKPFAVDRCGTCRRCIDACPTGAIKEDRMVDSRLCVSYLTIEHKGEISPDLAPGIGGNVFGCDICQDVCPWNKKRAFVSRDAALAMDPKNALLDLSSIENASEDLFRELYQTKAFGRAGLAGMRRNGLIVRRNQHVADKDGC
ncbi:MAG: tRNA epoxyqueuosine(34) reductase QueG [Myxococcota bacterium]|nr:tRNA epoxyqueuosine(34) reductase QueG [Myxococcota bacterium]